MAQSGDDTDMTSGVRVPFSTCRVRSLYFFCFSFLFNYYDLRSSCLTHRFAVGLKTLRSKNATWPVNQKHAHWHQLYLDLIDSQFSRKVFHPSAAAIVVLHGHPCKMLVNRFAVYFGYWSWRKVRNSSCGYWRVCCK